MRFSLAKLLGLTTAVSLLSGAWVMDGQRQAAAVAAIQDLGGHVYYETESVLPQEWVDKLSGMLGDDFVRRVHTACPAYDKYDQSLPHLKRLRGLERVYYWLTPPDVTAERLAADLPGVELQSKMIRVF